MAGHKKLKSTAAAAAQQQRQRPEKVRKPGTATSFSKIVMKTSSRPHSALSGSAAKLLTMLQLLAFEIRRAPPRPPQAPKAGASSLSSYYERPLPHIKKAEYKMPDNLTGRRLTRGGQEHGASWVSMLTTIMPIREERTAATLVATSSRWDFWTKSIL